METNHKILDFTQINSEELEEFRLGFGGSLIGAEDSAFDSERQLFNKMIDKKPGLIAQCTGVHDVILAVNFARKNNLLVAIRCGGHSVAGHAMNDDGLVIDLSHMRAVLVDPKNKTVVVQGEQLGQMLTGKHRHLDWFVLAEWSQKPELADSPWVEALAGSGVRQE